MLSWVAMERIYEREVLPHAKVGKQTGARPLRVHAKPLTDGELLAKLGLPPQKPLQRAYQRDPEAIEAWQRERYPAIARQAKASGGEVYFWDESGFRADSVHGRTWGRKGQTPVVERPGQRQSISAASAVNARGGFWYCTYQGGLNGEVLCSVIRFSA